jgi:hypothetical protein
MTLYTPPRKKHVGETSTTLVPHSHSCKQHTLLHKVRKTHIKHPIIPINTILYTVMLITNAFRGKPQKEKHNTATPGGQAHNRIINKGKTKSTYTQTQHTS